MKTFNRIVRFILACCMLPWLSAAQADEWQMIVGLVTFAEEGADLQLNYRQSGSHYQFGYRYLRWKEVTHDPYSGNPIAETHSTMTGPLLNYLFTPDDWGTLYLGVELLKWTRTEEALNVVVPSDTKSTTDFYFGGGFAGRIGHNFYYNLGMYLSPTAKLTTRLANGNYTESSGNFDAKVQFGLMF